MLDVLLSEGLPPSAAARGPAEALRGSCGAADVLGTMATPVARCPRSSCRRKEAFSQRRARAADESQCSAVPQETPLLPTAWLSGGGSSLANGSNLSSMIVLARGLQASAGRPFPLLRKDAKSAPRAAGAAVPPPPAAGTGPASPAAPAAAAAAGGRASSPKTAVPTRAAASIEIPVTSRRAPRSKAPQEERHVGAGPHNVSLQTNPCRCKLRGRAPGLPSSSPMPSASPSRRPCALVGRPRPGWRSRAVPLALHAAAAWGSGSRGRKGLLPEAKPSSDTSSSATAVSRFGASSLPPPVGRDMAGLATRGDAKAGPSAGSSLRRAAAGSARGASGPGRPQDS